MNQNTSASSGGGGSLNSGGRSLSSTGESQSSGGIALMMNGGVRRWGNNDRAQLGNGIANHYTTALPVPGTYQ